MSSRASSARRRRVPTASRLVWQPRPSGLARRPDELAVEEPLELRLGTGAERAPRTLTVTMRTPGHDFELALGWLLSEGALSGPGDVAAVRYCTDATLDAEQRYNVVTVDLSPAGEARLAERGHEPRLAMTASSCGVCGTASIEALSARGLAEVPPGPSFALEDVLAWPELLRADQEAFSATGGLHAAGLVTASGELVVAREDIGRHNAVDKVIGWALFEAMEKRRPFPLSDLGLVVSGRTSFEIVQKALSAGIAVVAAVSAASSLAARLAEEKGLSLLGFVREGRGTVYAHPERLAGQPA